MNRALSAGDRFVFKPDVRFAGYVRFSKAGPPFVDFSRLRVLDVSEDSSISACWTQHGPNGWRRKRVDNLDVAWHALPGQVWRVVSTAMTGGGCGHGPHDVYPDGHYVTCRRDDGDEVLGFYQSGCFRGMVLPDCVDLVA